MLFDWLVTGQVVPTNPAHSVRGPRHLVSRGSTPVLASEEASMLLGGMDVSSVVGLRDRALIAVMTYTFARVSAVVSLRVEDYYSQKKRWWVRLRAFTGSVNVEARRCIARASRVARYLNPTLMVQAVSLVILARNRHVGDSFR